MTQYPYTNFHDYNLDWILDQIKTMLAEWVSTRADWNTMQADNTALRAEWAQFQADMQAWLDTNVPAEIREELLEMVNDGTIYNIILNGDTEHPEPIKAAVESWLNEHGAVTEGYLVDDTLSEAGAAADAEATGEAVRVTLPFKLGKWEYGYVSSNGTDGGSTSTTNIRIPGPSFTNFPRTINYSIPENYRLRLVIYSSATGSYSNGPWLTGTGNYTFAAQVTNFRMFLANVSGESAIPLTLGDSVLITYEVAIGDYLAEQVEAINPDHTDFSMVTDFGVIGDSWASGSLHYPTSPTYIGSYPQSWPQILARKSGARAINFSKGGLSSKTWLTDSTGLPFLLANDPLPLYIIALGINDNTQIEAGTLALGTIDDVHVDDFTQNPDTFFGDYGKIIGNIKAHAPDAKIICVSVMRVNERANMDTRIAAIADKYGIPFIDLSQDDYFTSRDFYNAIYNGHPVAYGYGGIAKQMEKLICKTILSNPKYWSTYKPFEA